MGKHIPIFHNKLAGFLMYRGFVLQGMEKSTNSGDRKLNIYFFNSSEEIKNTINEFRGLNNK